MNNTYLYSYNPHSEGSKQLAQALGIKRIRQENSNFVPASHKKIINWGGVNIPDSYSICQVQNKKESLKESNKLNFFKLMDQPDGPRIPPYTTEIDRVMGWLADEHSVCIRRTLTSHSAEGMSIIRPEQIDHLVLAPLYTRYIKKKEEYRIHFAYGEIIDTQRKALRKTDDEGNEIDKSDVNFQIRNHQNGFVFVRQNLVTPEDVLNQAQKTIDKLTLDFGAIDIIWNAKEDQAYVLEVNTAPGLCGQTVETYANIFRSKLS